MIPNLDKILKEWSYRVGVIDYKNDKHLYHLNEILNEKGWPYTIIEELIQNLTEDDIVKNKKSGNTYVVKTHNKDTQDLIKKDASKDDIEKIKKGDDEEDKSDEKLNTDLALDKLNNPIFGVEAKADTFLKKDYITKEDAKQVKNFKSNMEDFLKKPLNEKVSFLSRLLKV